MKYIFFGPVTCISVVMVCRELWGFIYFQTGKGSSSSDTFSGPVQRSGINLLISAHFPPPFPDTVLCCLKEVHFRKALVRFLRCVPASDFLFFLQFHPSDRNSSWTSGHDRRLFMFLFCKASWSESQTTWFQTLKLFFLNYYSILSHPPVNLTAVNFSLRCDRKTRWSWECVKHLSRQTRLASVGKPGNPNADDRSARS